MTSNFEVTVYNFKVTDIRYSAGATTELITIDVREVTKGWLRVG